MRQKKFSASTSLRNCKGQIGFETLMLYGWAMVAIAAVIGALAYTGVISVDTLFPDICNSATGMSCLDTYDVHRGDNVVKISVRNELGSGITLVNGSSVISASKSCNFIGLNASTNSVPDTDLSTGQVQVNNGETATVKIKCGPINSGKAKIELSLHYTNQDNGLNYTNVIMISTALKK